MSTATALDIVEFLWTAALVLYASGCIGWAVHALFYRRPPGGHK